MVWLWLTLIGDLAVQGGSPWLAGSVEIVGQRSMRCRVAWVDPQDFREPGEALFHLAVAQRPLPEFPANGHVVRCVPRAQLESALDTVFDAQFVQPGLTLRGRLTPPKLLQRNEVELMPVAMPR